MSLFDFAIEKIKEKYKRLISPASNNYTPVENVLLINLREAFIAGQTFSWFRKTFYPKLEQFNILIKQEDLELIYNTYCSIYYARDRYQGMIENIEYRPYWMFDVLVDGHTRKKHAAKNEKVYRFDDPVWIKGFPPNGWGCRCSIRAVAKEDIKQRGLKISKGKDDVIDDPEFAFNPGTVSQEFIEELILKQFKKGVENEKIGDYT